MRPCVEKCMVFLFGKIKDIIIKNLVFKPLFVNKSILFSSYFSCFKNENKKEKERVFYKRKTWRYGEIFAKIAGNWLRMIKIKMPKTYLCGFSAFVLSNGSSLALFAGNKRRKNVEK